MKSHFKQIVIFACGFLLISANCYAKNKYEYLLDNKEMKAYFKYYEENIKTNSMIMDYLNLIVSSPNALYEELVEHDCDKEILKFAKDNKSFIKTLMHIRVIMFMSNSNVKDNELIFVTNYIKSPTALAATNQQEMGMETAFMREMTAFKVYELFTAPGGFKDQLEELLPAMEKAHSQK